MFGKRNAGGDAASPSTYQMHQRMFSIGDDFWIENGAGQRVFTVDGKALRIRKTLELQDASGRVLFKIQEKLVTIRDVMSIEGPGGRIATVKKALFTPLRERYEIEFDAGGKWETHGNIVDHKYEIKSDDGQIAEISKKWFRVRDTYGVQIAPGQDDAFVLAVAIVVDQMAHPAR
jgi:uncharacterized protein YxjI